MMAAVGMSPIPISAATSSDTTLDEVIFINNKGMSLNSLGKFNESITYFDKALAIDPKNIDALTGKGDVLSNLGNNTESVAYYDKALAIDPKNIDVSTGKKQSLADK
jgi:tetratricopeptide (TPR) repeat protein